MIYELLFSATGRSKEALDIISGQWGDEKTRIDLSVPDTDMGKYNITEKDFCILCSSVIEGRIPKPALENLKRLHGNGAKILLVAVFGNRSIDDCLLEMKDVAKSQGFVPVAAIEASVQHSIINRVCADRPDPADIRELKEFASQVKAMLDENKVSGELMVPGNYPYVEMGGVKFKPQADDNCIECGLCAKKCPMKAIPADNPHITDISTCITCMRCIEICPVKARHLPEGIPEMAFERMKEKFIDRKPNKLYISE